MSDSSAVERAPVKRVVAGSIPARTAIFRRPIIPVCYETACRALTECLNINEAKLWDDRAEALAAWAKIYHDNDAARKARALKLHAYRRMGQLSRELTKDRPKFDEHGPVKGARGLLIEKGLKVNDADACIRLAKARDSSFQKAINSPKPPAPSAFMQKVRGEDMTDMAVLVRRAFVEAGPFCKKTTAAEAASSISVDERDKFREHLTPIYEWLDDFLLRMNTISKRK